MLFFCILSNLAFASNDAIMRIRCVHEESTFVKTQHGSCVAVVDPDGKLDSKRTILTAAHVVSDPKATILVEASEGRWVRCSVVRINTESDLALLECSEDLESAVEIQKNLSLTVVASSLGENVKSNSAKLSLCQAKFKMTHGMSGGAVLTADGKLCGLITAGIGDKIGEMKGDEGVFVSMQQIREFLKEK